MRINRDRLAAYLLITPSLVAVAIFIYGFIGWTMRVSLTNWKGLAPNYDWAGFVNYVNLFADRRFLIAVNNTILFTLLFMAGSLLLGLLLALMLDAGLPGEGLFRSIYLLPMSISFIVTGVVWRWLMNPAQGDRLSGINLIFQALGLDGLINSWYTTPTYGIAAIALPAVWQMSGYVMALYLAGLRSIPEEVREAARVDGANSWQLFRYIVFPLLQPVTLSAVVILAHISLKVFDLILAVAGKQIQLDVPAIYMWNITFDGNFYARGASIAILILVAVSIFVIPYLITSIRTEAKV
jgi:glucose/mannose transport system permease protein